MRFHREQYLDLLGFRGAVRPMFVELFGPLVGLEEEWRAQGAAEDEISMEAFDWDWVPTAPCGGVTGLFGAPPSRVLSETAEYRLERDGLGRTVKLPKGYATIGLPMDFPVKGMDDWLAVKPLYSFREERIDGNAVEAARVAREREGAVVVATIPGAFDTPRELMGDEAACLCYYENPELMRDILDTVADTSRRVLAAVGERVTIDQVSVHEDLAGKSGPMAGPKQVTEFFRPYFRPLWDMMASRGCRVFQMDSDGNINPIIEALLACGLNSLFPMEPAAGMDMVDLRRRFGNRFAVLGGIDKHVLRGTRADIRRELEYKLQPLMREGGTVFGLDHRIPNGTPLENYRYYVGTGREILGLPPLSASSRGWRRMAF